MVACIMTRDSVRVIQKMTIRKIQDFYSDSLKFWRRETLLGFLAFRSLQKNNPAYLTWAPEWTNQKEKFCLIKIQDPSPSKEMWRPPTSAIWFLWGDLFQQQGNQSYSLQISEVKDTQKESYTKKKCTLSLSSINAFDFFLSSFFFWFFLYPAVTAAKGKRYQRIVAAGHFECVDFGGLFSWNARKHRPGYLWHSAHVELEAFPVDVVVREVSLREKDQALSQVGFQILPARLCTN